MANLENYTKKVLILYNDRRFVKMIFRKHNAKKIMNFLSARTAMTKEVQSYPNK